MVVKFPSCLGQLSENPVEGVCRQTLFLKQEIFHSAVFSNKFFHLKKCSKVGGVCF